MGQLVWTAHLSGTANMKWCGEEVKNKRRGEKYSFTKAVTECPESRACRTACRPETKNVDEYFFPQHFPNMET